MKNALLDVMEDKKTYQSWSQTSQSRGNQYISNPNVLKEKTKISLVKEYNGKRRDYSQLWKFRWKPVFPQVTKIFYGEGIPNTGKQYLFHWDFWYPWPREVSGAVSSIQNQNNTFLRALHLFWKTIFLSFQFLSL